MPKVTKNLLSQHHPLHASSSDALDPQREAIDEATIYLEEHESRYDDEDQAAEEDQTIFSPKAFYYQGYQQQDNTPILTKKRRIDPELTLEVRDAENQQGGLNLVGSVRIPTSIIAKDPQFEKSFKTWIKLYPKD